METMALSALYSSWGGAAWANNTNWLGTAGPCSINAWHGVECNSGAEVRMLNLSSNNLDGTIPPYIAGLSALEEIHLTDNKIAGTMPVELSLLGQMRAVVLDRNDLSGSIPCELGLLSGMHALVLKHNSISGTLDLVAAV